MPTLDQLAAQLDRLAAFEAGSHPVLSLYLNMQPDQHGRDHYAPFLRKELDLRLRTYPASGGERDSLTRDAERIRQYMEGVDASANGLALFACAGEDLFEAVQLAAPIAEHRLYISDQPHLYPIARLLDEYPRYTALVADTRSARIFVFAANSVERRQEIEGTPTRRHKMGGWSQARYQRRIDNFHQQHARDIADTLTRIVREENVRGVVLAGDEVIVPLIREELPAEVTGRIVDVLKLDIRTPEHEILDASVKALRQKDADTDREVVEALLGAYRAGGLAVVGVEDTRLALEMGQVEELVMTAVPEAIDAGEPRAGDVAPERTAEERAADELIAGARQTAARIRFIEDRALLAPVGGVGALLRFKV